MSDKVYGPMRLSPHFAATKLAAVEPKAPTALYKQIDLKRGWYFVSERGQDGVLTMHGWFWLHDGRRVQWVRRRERNAPTVARIFGEDL